MGGTVAGGRKAYLTNTENDPDFYKRIGAIGGRTSKGGGFSEGEAGRERARKWGKVGGTISRRGTGLTEQERARIRVQYEASNMQVSRLSKRFK